MTSLNLELDLGDAAQGVKTHQDLDDDPTFEKAGR